jgi:hypothetical protein
MTAILSSRYQTSCSICRMGIFEGQSAVWTRGRHLGMSHIECAQTTCPRCGVTLAPTDVEACLACVVTRERFGDLRELTTERFVNGLNKIGASNG